MVNTRLLKTTLMAASAAIALTAVPSWADEEDSGDTTTSTAWGDGDGVAVSEHSYSGNIVINYDDFTGITASNAKTITPSSENGVSDLNSATLSGTGYQGSWLMFTDGTSTTTSRSVEGTVSGTGFFGIAFLNSTSNAATIDLTGLSSSSFSGQLMVANAYASPFTVEIGGDWSDTEFVFEGVSREWWDKSESSTHANAYGDGTDADKGFYAIASVAQSGNAYEVETLQLSSDTSFAGISGTSEGYTLNSVSLNSKEVITASSSGTVLTLTGSGEYAFYGTVGSSSVALDIAKTGEGKQTLGGTNYLGNVTVSAGELVLGTLDVTHNDTTISGSGTISIGTVTIGSSGTARALSIGTDDSATTVTVGEFTLAGTTTVNIASGSTLAVSGTFDYSSGYTSSITGGGTLTADEMNLSGNGEKTISLAELTVGTMSLLGTEATTISVTNLTVAGTMELSATGATTISVANATIGSIVNDSTSGTRHVVTITEGSTVNAGSFSRSLGILDLEINGVLNIAKNDETGATGVIAIGTTTDSGGNIGATQYIAGTGSLNAYGISYYSGNNSSAYVDVSIANLNIGEGGITNEGSNGNFEFTGDTGTTVGLYNATTATISSTLWLNSSAGTTFNPEAGQTMTLAGAITGGDGHTLVKTGDGTLVLSADNSYSGGTTISAGTVVAENASAFGTGTVTVADGATLQVDIAISTGAITFNEGSLLVIGSDLLASAVVESDADPEVAMVAATATEIISATSITFGDTVLESGDVSETVNAFISSDITSAYDLTWTYDGSALSVSATATTPEPSMFGLLAGLGALGLVATRRRRNRKA